jgi:nucleoside-diphosphate-sugar epimerase
MKKVLIMGITGAFGAAVAQSLKDAGWSIKALLRDPARLPEQFKGIEVVQGDVSQIDRIRIAVEDVELVVYGINPAKYDWKDKALPWLENTAQIVEEQKLTLVFPGNVYVYNPQDGPDFDEESGHQPISSKGTIREAMENRLQVAAQNGARIIILRLGDFFAPNLPSSWLAAVLKSQSKSYQLATPGPSNLKHTWAYLPDVAQALALLVDKRENLPEYAEFNFAGYQVTWLEIAEALQRIKQTPVKIKAFPWWLLRLLKPFSVMFASLLEMRYLWQTEINLKDQKLVEFLGQPLPQTPLQEALKISLGLTKYT